MKRLSGIHLVLCNLVQVVTLKSAVQEEIGHVEGVTKDDEKCTVSILMYYYCEETRWLL